MSDQFQERLRKMGLIQSMSRRGNCWDNAAMESFFGHLKDHCHFAGCAAFQEVKKMIDDYIEYYNNERRAMDKDEDDACRICKISEGDGRTGI